MPTTLTEASTFDTPITVPNEGEGATAASVTTTAINRLTNRTKYLKTLTETDGVVRRRYVANVAALKAIGAGSRADGDLVEVGGLGCFQFVSAAADATQEPWIVVPTAGAGRWYHTLKDIRGGYSGARGLASLGATGRLAELSQQQIMQSFLYRDTTGGDLKISSSTSYEDAGFGDINVGTTAVGDILLITTAWRTKTTAPETCKTQIRVSENAGANLVDLAETEQTTPTLTGGDPTSRWSVTTRYEITQAGTTVVRLRIKTSNGAIPATLAGPGVTTVLWIRP